MDQNQDNFYFNDYNSLIYSGTIGFIAKLMHKSMETRLLDDSSKIILELGAGHGQHLNYVKQNFDIYFETDLRLNNLPKRSDPRIISKQVDATDLVDFEDSSIDRLISTCLLAHLENPEKALIEWKRVVKNQGTLSIYLPSEPGLLLRMVRFNSTARKSKRLGIDHYSQHYREHKNYYLSLEKLILETFKDSYFKKTSFPINHMSWNLSLWKVFQIKNIK